MQSHDIWGWLHGLGADDIVPVLFVLLMGLVALVAIICGTIHAMYKSRVNHALKRELLDRGLSAEEIATIISAKAGSRQSD